MIRILAPLWYFRLAIPPTSSAYRCCEMRIRGVLLSFLSVFDSTLIWHVFPMKGHSPCNHWTLRNTGLAPDMRKYLSELYRSQWSHFVHLEVDVIYCLIEERCVTVFSDNPEWMCSFVFPLSSNCHLLGFLALHLSWFQPWLCLCQIVLVFLHCPF